MTKIKNNTNINIAYWFYQKGNEHNTKLSEEKIQNLLFLSQLHYCIKYKKLLMPSLFIYSGSKIYDPTISTIMDHGFPLIGVPDFDLQTTDFLELIWQKYATQTQTDLQKFIYSIKSLKDLKSKNDECIINPLDLSDSFSSTIKHEIKPQRSKIMISQNGPVKVSAWTPRKLNTQTQYKGE